LALAPPDDWYVSAFIVPALKLPAVGVPKLKNHIACGLRKLKLGRSHGLNGFQTIGSGCALC
jgi:hypothetical protein